jgi:tetratricopeptide (TPR) repeat protein
LIVAYRFGSTFLSEPPPRGAGKPELGIKLLERGIQANPEFWRFYEDLGFIYYFELKDYHKAAEAFLEGSKKPGALIWMKTFAAKISEQGETRETSVMLWSEVYSSAANADLKNNALTHLRLLRAQSDCEQLDRIAGEYEKRIGHRPKSMRDLVNAGLLPQAAVDPLGFVYYFDEAGKAQLNPASPLFREQAKQKAL